jgi:hypothetical protein
MLGTISSKSDRFFTPTVRDRLFETKPGNGFDLNALNIQRGRDHGIPGYNSMCVGPNTDGIKFYVRVVSYVDHNNYKLFLQ